jgi:exonuclease-1
MLKSNGIKTICVFDGLQLKAKAETVKERLDSKKSNRELGHEKDKSGDNEEARKHFSRSLVLRTCMIDLFMDILKELEIEFIVAPYEADAQMAYMVQQGLADFAISEDSDLIAYGCPSIVMKLPQSGFGA